MSQAWDSYHVLVHRTDDGRLEVDQSTLNLLNEIHDPVQVVSLVGPFRTGKSYLLNNIIKRLTSRESVFPVGETVLAATRGINVWCCPHPSCEGMQLVFLDMEGLDDTAKGDKENDLQIFVLAVLLSSTLVYNSRGVIDMHALETLYHVSYLANRVRMTSDARDDLDDLGFDLAFPEFLWVVRDFQLVLEHNGKEITDAEYLENSLSTLNSGLRAKRTMQVSIKRCIKEYFPKRKCFLFPNLLQIDDASAETRFKFSALIDQILSGNCKMHEGSEVTGRVFGKLAAQLVDSVQDPNKPIEIPLIMNEIARKENSAVVANAFEHYRSLMNERMTEPVDEVRLLQIHLQCTEDTTAVFLQSSVYPIDSYLIQLMNDMKQEFDRISEQNATKIEDLCNRKFDAFRQEVIGPGIDKYLCPGGYQRYREDMTEIRKRWETVPVLQGTAGRHYFMEKLRMLREVEANMIMNADREMTNLKRDEAAKRHEKERQEMEEMRRKSEETVKQDQEAFQERIDSKVKGVILRPDEEEISRLKLRIEVLERQLIDQSSGEMTEEEAESCEHRINKYKKILEEKQNEPSRWSRVSTSIQTFVTGACDSVRKFFRKPEIKSAVQTAAAVAAASVAFGLSIAQSRSMSWSTPAIIATAATQGLSAALQPPHKKDQDQSSATQPSDHNQGQSAVPQPSGYYNQGQSAVPQPSGYYSQGQSAVPQPSGYYSQGQSAVPQPSGYYNQGQSAVPQPSGYYNQGQSAVPQPSGYYNQGQSAVPQPSGYYNQGQSAVPQPSGYYNQGQSAVPQPSGYYNQNSQDWVGLYHRK